MADVMITLGIGHTWYHESMCSDCVSLVSTNPDPAIWVFLGHNTAANPIDPFEKSSRITGMVGCRCSLTPLVPRQRIMSLSEDPTQEMALVSLDKRFMML